MACMKLLSSPSTAGVRPSSAFRPLPFSSGLRPRLVVVRAEPTQSTTESKQTPSTSQEDVPVWVRREKERELQAAEAAKAGLSLPWPLALLFSTFVAIAATGSIFEYIDRNPIFGVIQPENPVWAPILLFMAVTGYPTAGFLFKVGVDGFNRAAELQDRLDGYTSDDSNRR